MKINLHFELFLRKKEEEKKVGFHNLVAVINMSENLLRGINLEHENNYKFTN